MLKDTGSGSHTQEIVAKNLLFNGAELTECGQLTYTLENAPSYLSLSGTTLTVTSDSLQDTEDTSVVTLKVSLDGNSCVEESVEFTVGLACPTDTICDFSGTFSPDTLPEVSCDAGDPETLAGFTGTIGDNPATDSWYIEYGNYMLTKIQRYGNTEVTSGFEAFYEAYPPGQFSGWPQLYHLYGSKDLGAAEELILTKDIVVLGICGDSSGPHGFEGFSVLEYSEPAVREIVTNDCSDWFTLPIFEKRIVGFDVTTSDYEYEGQTITNIRTIAPIVDCIECTTTNCIVNQIADLSVAVGSGTDTMSISIQDTVSQFYGTFDGFTFCGARTTTLDGADGLSWLTRSDDLVTISSTNFLD